MGYPDDEYDEYVEYDEYGTPKRKRNPFRGATLFEWVRLVALPLVLALLGLSAVTIVVTIVFAPQFIFGGNVTQNISGYPSSETPYTPPTTPPIHTSGPRLLERYVTVPQSSQSYTVSLLESEAIIGDAWDVENRGIEGCVVFWTTGPHTVTFEVMDGAWYRYANVTDAEDLDGLIQSRVRYLQTQHWYCKNASITTVELGS